MSAPTRPPAPADPADRSNAPATSADVLRFALRQGPLRRIMHPAIAVDERIPTTATVPPAAARDGRYRPLPLGTAELPAAGAPDPATALGRALLTAFGLQRREPANPANDHRAVASVRSKFPVHVLVVPPAPDPPAYLDLYRHALVDVTVDPALAAPLRPVAGAVTVVLAARHTDLPTPYGILRCALGDLETGVNLRSLLVAAQLGGIGAGVAVTGPRVGAAAGLLAASGPGSWGAPVVVTLGNTTMPGYADHPADPPFVEPLFDELLRTGAAHPTLQDTAAVNDVRRHPATDSPVAAAPPALPLPAVPPHWTDGDVDWAHLLWERSAGRVPAGLTGFSAQPASRGRECLDALLAWAAVPPPGPELREVASRVRLTLFAQRLGDLPTGRYAVVDGQVAAATPDPLALRRLEQTFGYPLTESNDCGVRHAVAAWVYSVDLRALVGDLGPAAWGLLQVHCGWIAHGLTMAAARHGLFARPARSFDEHLLADLVGLPDDESPVFLTVCGRSRYAEPMLDLRA